MHTDRLETFLLQAFFSDIFYLKLLPIYFFNRELAPRFQSLFCRRQCIILEITREARGFSEFFRLLGLILLSQSDLTSISLI